MSTRNRLFVALIFALCFLTAVHFLFDGPNNSSNDNHFLKLLVGTGSHSRLPCISETGDAAITNSVFRAYSTHPPPPPCNDNNMHNKNGRARNDNNDDDEITEAAEIIARSGSSNSSSDSFHSVTTSGPDGSISASVSKKALERLSKEPFFLGFGVRRTLKDILCSAWTSTTL
jgi:hypothetical protein